MASGSPIFILVVSPIRIIGPCLTVVIRAIETDLIQRAGLTRESHARGGIVTLLQRFGSALNLNIHLHMIVLDGPLIPDPEQPWLNLDFHEPMDSLSAASVRYRIAIGPRSDNRTLTLHNPFLIRTDKPIKTVTADRDGFSLNAAVSCQSDQPYRV